MSNITEWGLRRINEHYREEFGERFEEVVDSAAITAEDVFAYTYAVLHDPAYREEYKVDLLREFPRLPLYDDWTAWVKNGAGAAGLAYRVRGCRGVWVGTGGQGGYTDRGCTEGDVASKCDGQGARRDPDRLGDGAAGCACGCLAIHAWKQVRTGVGSRSVQREEAARPDYQRAIQHVQIHGLQGRCDRAAGAGVRSERVYDGDCGWDGGFPSHRGWCTSMDIDQVAQLVETGGESETLEFKKTTGTRREASRTVCAFLNQRGGQVLFGVTAVGVVAGQQVSDRTIEELSAELQRIDPPVFPTVERIHVSGNHEVIVVNVDQGTLRP